MVIQLHGVPFSTCTRRVAVVLKHLGVPYELVSVAFHKAEHKTPEFLEKQPFGQVPYMDDDGFILFESRAIARYVATKYGAGALLAPAGDVQRAALFEQAVSVEGANFDPSASGIVGEAIFKPMHGGATDAARVAQLTETLAKKLDGYERILAKQKYLAGDALTLADLFHLPYGSMLAQAGVALLQDEGRYPHVARWWAELENLPAWQAVKGSA